MHNVSDIKGNTNDYLVHAANKIGKSALKQKVFRAIYFGKKRIKTVADIAQTTKLSRKNVLNAAKKLETAKLIHQTRHEGDTAYTKDDAYKDSWKKVLTFAGNNKKIATVQTKVNPGGRKAIVNIKIPIRQVKIQQITIDDVSSFSGVKKIKSAKLALANMPEAKFKKGLLKILKETGPLPKDWGGEKNDVFTNRLQISGKRYHAAFALKGPGKNINKITSKHMGKNGDQIQRLMRSSAQVFFVQYWKEIDQSIVEQMEQFSIAKSYSDGRRIYFGIIDGDDSSRLIQAYPNAFK